MRLGNTLFLEWCWTQQNTAIYSILAFHLHCTGIANITLKHILFSTSVSERWLNPWILLASKMCHLKHCLVRFLRPYERQLRTRGQNPEIQRLCRKQICQNESCQGWSSIVRLLHSEPQSTEENTATESPEAAAISLNHGQHNPVRRLTTKKSELVIVIVGTCIALAALVLQFTANRLSKEANELTRLGNAVAEKSYKLQLWDNCHDRQVIRPIKGAFHKSETYFTRTCKILIFVKMLQPWTKGVSLFGSGNISMYLVASLDRRLREGRMCSSRGTNSNNWPTPHHPHQSSPHNHQ